jgi:hypothetical protein
MSVVLGHATIVITLGAYTTDVPDMGRAEPNRSPGWSSPNPRTGRAPPAAPTGRCLQIRLQVRSHEALQRSPGTPKAPGPAGQGPSAVVGDTGIEPVTSSV